MRCNHMNEFLLSRAAVEVKEYVDFPPVVGFHISFLCSPPFTFRISYNGELHFLRGSIELWHSNPPYSHSVPQSIVRLRHANFCICPVNDFIQDRRIAVFHLLPQLFHELTLDGNFVCNIQREEHYFDLSVLEDPRCRLRISEHVPLRLIVPPVVYLSIEVAVHVNRTSHPNDRSDFAREFWPSLQYVSQVAQASGAHERYGLVLCSL
mmetsp:Transcript_5214/g.13624  ORF Transcript_5214/g.13624 Transcript_5214/m.13624 type:complete len:208 (-) Transcript_5214:371-994(-)